jgi:hypothetical protein
MIAGVGDQPTNLKSMQWRRQRDNWTNIHIFVTQ